MAIYLSFGGNNAFVTFSVSISNNDNLYPRSQLWCIYSFVTRSSNNGGISFLALVAVFSAVPLTCAAVFLPESTRSLMR
jgi:hypothetical protein